MVGRVLLVGRARANGWASATSWGNESKLETYIFELNWVIFDEGSSRIWW